MASKAFIRTIIVVVLFVTAHTIKPFTFGSVTLQALGTARSLSVVMPEIAAEHIGYAHHLASIYGKGLFDETPWTQQNLLQSNLANLVAFANSVETLDDADIKDVKPGDLNRKSTPKRPIKRIKRDENRDDDSDCNKNSEIAKLPQSISGSAISYLTPIAKPRLLKDGYITTAVRSELANPKLMQLDCGIIELPEIKAVALIHHLPKSLKSDNLKIQLVLISQPASLTAVCRDASVTKVETEATAEIVVGPEEQLDEAAAEEQEMAPAPQALISIPRTPECIRIP